MVMYGSMSQEAYDEMMEDRARGPVNPWAEEHAEAMQLGLPCPFDCAACERRALRHAHECTGCERRDDCYDERCWLSDADLLEEYGVVGPVWSAERDAFEVDPADCRTCSLAPIDSQPVEPAPDPWDDAAPF